MTEVTSTSTIVEMTPNAGGKAIKITTAAADTSDTIVITLSEKGISSFEGILGMVHTTANSVIVGEAPTTAVSAGVLTITIGGSTVTNKKRTYIVWGS